METGKSTNFASKNEQSQRQMAAQQLLEHDIKKVLSPDFKRPFTSLEDACERLLPYHVIVDYRDEDEDETLNQSVTTDGKATSASLIWDETVTDKVVEFTTTFEEQVRTFNAISRKRGLGELRAEERWMMEGLLLQETKRAQRAPETTNADVGQTSQGPRETHETVNVGNVDKDVKGAAWGVS